MSPVPWKKNGTLRNQLPCRKLATELVNTIKGSSPADIENAKDSKFKRLQVRRSNVK